MCGLFFRGPHFGHIPVGRFLMEDADNSGRATFAELEDAFNRCLRQGPRFGEREDKEINLTKQRKPTKSNQGSKQSSNQTEHTKQQNKTSNKKNKKQASKQASKQSSNQAIKQSSKQDTKRRETTPSSIPWDLVLYV